MKTLLKLLCLLAIALLLTGCKAKEEVGPYSGENQAEITTWRDDDLGATCYTLTGHFKTNSNEEQWVAAISCIPNSQLEDK
jgi:outer membrane biogenesis lipoprotein LolB